MRSFVLLLFIFLGIGNANAQWVLINQNGGDPDNSAALEVVANDKGILVPKMTYLQREAIVNPADGLLIYQTDSVNGLYYSEGSEWKTIGKNTIVNNDVSTSIAVVRDVKPSGVDGGTFTSGSWDIRDLNDLRGDSSFISIDGVNTFTLDSGLYEISASAQARDVEEHQIRLFNVTDGTVSIIGLAQRSEVADPAAILNSVIKINSQKTFRIEHRCTLTNNATVAKGTGVSWGENVFSQVRIEKL